MNAVHTNCVSSLKQENMRPINPSSINWYDACVLRSKETTHHKKQYILIRSRNFKIRKQSLSTRIVYHDYPKNDIKDKEKLGKNQSQKHL